MSEPCIHGFQAGQCSRCLDDASRRTAVAAAADPEVPSEQRGDWEIVYVPALTGWQVRAPDAEALPDSYRSLFLARKAVDALIANGPDPRRSKRKP